MIRCAAFVVQPVFGPSRQGCAILLWFTQSWRTSALSRSVSHGSERSRRGGLRATGRARLAIAVERLRVSSSRRARRSWAIRSSARGVHQR
jgi:hypothetical protein